MKFLSKFLVTFYEFKKKIEESTKICFLLSYFNAPNLLDTLMYIECFTFCLEKEELILITLEEMLVREKLERYTTFHTDYEPGYTNKG